MNKNIDKLSKHKQEWKRAQAEGKKTADNIRVGIPPDPFSSANKRLDARMTEFLTQIIDASGYEALVKEWAGEDAVEGNVVHMDPRRTEAFSQWMIFDKLVPGQSHRIIELFAQKWMDRLPDDEKTLLFTQLNDRPSIYQIKKINPEKGKYLVHDFVANETIHIHDKATSRSLKMNDIFTGRAIPIEGKTVAYGLLGSVITVPAPRWDDLSKALIQWKKIYSKEKPKASAKEFFRVHHVQFQRLLWES